MRVCFVSRRFWPAISGMSVYAENLLRELVAAGHEVTMLSQFRGDPVGMGVYGGGPPPPVPGVTVVGMEAYGEQDGGDFEADVEALRQAVHDHGPFDVVHAQYGYPTGLAALRAARELGVPCVVSIQGGDGHWVGSCCGTHERAMRAVLDGADRLLIGSRSFAQEVHDRLGTPLERFTIVPGAVDPTRFTADPGHGLIYHGRVDRRKGVLDFLRAAPRDVPLVVSGIGPDLEPAKALAAELDLPVEWLGRVPYDEVPDVYARGHVFVSPTYGEGFSNTILEAMASGLACVSCRAVGVVDCLRDGENGLLVEPGDIDALAAALRRVLDDDALRERLAATALEEARTIYGWPTVARQIMDSYDVPAGKAPVPDEGPVEDCRFRAQPHLL